MNLTCPSCNQQTIDLTKHQGKPFLIFVCPECAEIVVEREQKISILSAKALMILGASDQFGYRGIISKWKNKYHDKIVFSVLESELNKNS